jgi:hypothetical protein
MYSTHSSSNCFNAWQLASTNVVYVFTRLLIQKDSYGMRERRLIEYFKQCFPSDISLTTNKELAYGLTSLPPYEVSISDVMVIHLHCQVPPSEVWHSLNATIVGLAISCGTIEAGRSIPWCAGLGTSSLFSHAYSHYYAYSMIFQQPSHVSLHP